jgi:hypothetical protein
MQATQAYLTSKVQTDHLNGSSFTISVGVFRRQNNWKNMNEHDFGGGVLVPLSCEGKNVLAIRCAKCIREPQPAMTRRCQDSLDNNACKLCYKYFQNTLKPKIKAIAEAAAEEQIAKNVNARKMRQLLRRAKRAEEKNKRKDDYTEWSQQPGNLDFDLGRFKGDNGFRPGSVF